MINRSEASRAMAIEARTPTDNLDLDLIIAERLCVPVDVVDTLPLPEVEAMREAIWLKGEIA